MYCVRRKIKENVCVQGELQLAVVSPELSDKNYIYTSMEEMMEDARETKCWKHLAYTLEPPLPPFYGKGMQKPAAIPTGLYEIEKRWSHKFKGWRWFLREVPDFEGIMFHVGNTASDTRGCILLGDAQCRCNITGSKLADERVRRRMNRYAMSGIRQFVKVVNEFQ